MSYDELVDYLLKKYGPAKYDYFYNANCKSRNPKVSRTKEGLYCHHIDEDKAIMLSMTDYAILNPFEYQKADRLVYCNILEHLLLHIKIIQEPKHPEANFFERQGAGGIINICHEINTYYSGYEYKQEWTKKMFECMADKFDQYIGILIYLKLLVKEYLPAYSDLINVDNLSQDFNGNRVDRIYNKISG